MSGLILPGMALAPGTADKCLNPKSNLKVLRQPSARQRSSCGGPARARRYGPATRALRRPPLCRGDSRSWAFSASRCGSKTLDVSGVRSLVLQTRSSAVCCDFFTWWLQGSPGARANPGSRVSCVWEGHGCLGMAGLRAPAEEPLSPRLTQSTVYSLRSHPWGQRQQEDPRHCRRGDSGFA